MRTASLALLLSACSCGASPGSPATPSLPPAGPSYSVHEWGLVRGTAADGVALSGPHADPVALPVAKPVLYFHREGEGELRVDVTVRMPHGAFVEHWPTSVVTGTTLRWPGVRIVAGACSGARYPGSYDAICLAAPGGCEASMLATVETSDADCLEWANGGAAPERWSHLFYRGEVVGAPALGLSLTPMPDGSLVVENDSGTTLPGRLVRVHRSAGVPDFAAVVDAPAPGASITIPRPTGTLHDGALGLGASLSAAGLTEAEVAAFRRDWDAELFGTLLAAAAAEPIAATATPTLPVPPPPPPAESSSLLYVLPASLAEDLAELDFTPAPTSVSRAIVAWIDEAAPPPADVLGAALADPHRFDCTTAADCTNSCSYGAVSSAWYTSTSALAGFGECLDGCAGPISAMPHCEAGRCVAYRIDPHGGGELPAPECTNVGAR